MGAAERHVERWRVAAHRVEPPLLLVVLEPFRLHRALQPHAVLQHRAGGVGSVGSLGEGVEWRPIASSRPVRRSTSVRSTMLPRCPRAGRGDPRVGRAATRPRRRHAGRPRVGGRGGLTGGARPVARGTHPVPAPTRTGAEFHAPGAGGVSSRRQRAEVRGPRAGPAHFALPHSRTISPAPPSARSRGRG